jgi:hypothetical protein
MWLSSYPNIQACKVLKSRGVNNVMKVMEGDDSHTSMTTW